MEKIKTIKNKSNKTKNKVVKTEKKKPAKKTQYFLEKEMNELVRIYKKDKTNEKVFSQIEPGLYGIINGMINKQFYRNYHIKNNRVDATADCMHAILTSLDRYDPDKGRLFAYTNRIVKNTLMSYYRRSRKVRDNEMNYTDLSRNMDENSTDDDNALKIAMKGEFNTDVTTGEQMLTSCTLKNVVLPIDTSIFIIYKYIKYLRESTNFFNTDEKKYKDLIDEMVYDTTIEFDFENYIDSIIMDKYEIYKKILEILDNSLFEIKLWLEENYEEVLLEEPESFNGSISNRAIGYIRNFVTEQLQSNITKKYNVYDLTQFLQYIVYKRHSIYGED